MADLHPGRARVGLALKPQDFVTAARALGRPDWSILARHITPNTLAPLTVIAFFEMARMIITEAALGFLGLGVQPPTATWGNMLADGRDYIRDAWWLSAFPGLAIMLIATASISSATACETSSIPGPSD